MPVLHLRDGPGDALVEQVMPFGRAVRKPLGGAPVAIALWRLINLEPALGSHDSASCRALL